MRRQCRGVGPIPRSFEENGLSYDRRYVFIVMLRIVDEAFEIEASAHLALLDLRTNAEAVGEVESIHELGEKPSQELFRVGEHPTRSRGAD
jgi:hypothetical protein